VRLCAPFLFNLSKRMTKAHFGLEVLYQWKLFASMWNCERSPPSRASDKTIRQRVLTDGCNIDENLQQALGDREVFQLPTILISSFLHNKCVIHHFLCFLPFVNLEMRYLLRGEGCNTPCYGFAHHLLITFISSLTTHQILGQIKF
jgi:hypothetical protein